MSVIPTRAGMARRNVAEAAIDAALRNPCTSYWLKGALRQAVNRDVLDATRDAEELASLLRGRLEAIYREGGP
jgi:hypothetical protein